MENRQAKIISVGFPKLSALGNLGENGHHYIELNYLVHVDSETLTSTLTLYTSRNHDEAHEE